MFTFVPSHPCFVSMFRLVYRAYLFGVLYSWILSEMFLVCLFFFFSLAFQKIQLPCMNLQTNQERLLLWCQQKGVTVCCCQQNVAMVHGKPDCPEHLFDMLVARGFSWSKGSQWTGCPMALGVSYFSFSLHSLWSCCAASLKCSRKSLLQFVIFFHWPILSILAQTKSGWWLT